MLGHHPLGPEKPGAVFGTETASDGKAENEESAVGEGHVLTLGCTISPSAPTSVPECHGGGVISGQERRPHVRRRPRVAQGAVGAAQH